MVGWADAGTLHFRLRARARHRLNGFANGWNPTGLRQVLRNPVRREGFCLSPGEASTGIQTTDA